MIQTGPDLIVRNQKSQNILTVEVRAATNFTRERAIEFRQQLIENDMLVDARYLLIVSQDTGFLWVNKHPKPANAKPDYEFPMNEIIQRYYTASFPNERIRPEVLPTVISHWLLDLSVQNRTAKDQPEAILADSGLLEALKDTTPNFTAYV